MAAQQQFDLITTVNPTATTTNGNTTAVDLARYVNIGGRNMKLYVSVGTVTGTSPTLDGIVQENTTSGASGWTSISGATITQVTTNGAQTVHFVPTKQYVRLLYTVGGTSPSMYLSAAFMAERVVK